MTTSTSTASTPVRTVLEIRAAIARAGVQLDRLDATIRDMQASREPFGRIDAALNEACNRHTTWCGITADLYDELVEAQAYEDYLDAVAHQERVLADYRLDQRL